MEIIINLALIAGIWSGLAFLAVGIVTGNFQDKDA
jgi:hypothetical protein